MGGATPSRILVLGIDGAGKTTFVNKVEKPKMDKPAEPTESYEQRDLKVGDVQFSVWDVAGKSSTRSIWSSYYKQGNVGWPLRPTLGSFGFSLVCLTQDAIIYVIDASDRDRLDEATRVLHSQLRDPELAGKMLFVVANKQDVDGALSAEELEAHLKLTQYNGKRVWSCVGCSAKQGTGVKEAIKLLSKEVKKEIKRIEKGLPVPLPGDKDKKKNGKDKEAKEAKEGKDSKEEKSEEESHESHESS